MADCESSDELPRDSGDEDSETEYESINFISQTHGLFDGDSAPDIFQEEGCCVAQYEQDPLCRACKLRFCFDHLSDHAGGCSRQENVAQVSPQETAAHEVIDLLTFKHLTNGRTLIGAQEAAASEAKTNIMIDVVAYNMWCICRGHWPGGLAFYQQFRGRRGWASPIYYCSGHSSSDLSTHQRDGCFL